MKTTTNEATPPTASLLAQKSGWPSVAALVPAAFALATTEFIPLGLVPSVAQHFSTTLGNAGLMVLVPGLVAAIAAPLAVVGTARIPRKQFVLLLSLALLVSNILACVAPTFGLLLVARGVTGLALGGFWAVVPVIAAQLVTSDKSHRATAYVISGISAGTVVGLPAGQFLSDAFGWRSAFASVAGLSLAVLIAQVLVLPFISARPAMRPAVFLDVLRSPRARLGLAVTIPAIVAQFAASTFVTPYLSRQAHLPDGHITVLLLAYGVAGIIGTLVGGNLVAKGPIPAAAGAVLALGLALGTLAFVPGIAPLVAALVIVWGFMWGIVPIAFQVWLMRSVPNAPEAASASLVTTFQLSIAIGALVGGLVVDSTGLHAVFAAAGGLAVATGIAAIITGLRHHNTSIATSTARDDQPVLDPASN